MWWKEEVKVEYCGPRQILVTSDLYPEVEFAYFSNFSVIGILLNFESAAGKCGDSEFGVFGSSEGAWKVSSFKATLIV